LWNVDVDDVRRDNHVNVVEPWIWLILKADTGGALALALALALACGGRTAALGVG
jgi:hypothetical protein